MGWTAVYCIFNLVLISIVISEVRHQVRHVVFSTFLFMFGRSGVSVPGPRIVRLSANLVFYQYPIFTRFLFHQKSAYLVVPLLDNAN